MNIIEVYNYIAPWINAKYIKIAKRNIDRQNADKYLHNFMAVPDLLNKKFAITIQMPLGNYHFNNEYDIIKISINKKTTIIKNAAVLWPRHENNKLIVELIAEEVI